WARLASLRSRDTAAVGGHAASARRDLGRARDQLCAVLGRRGKGRTLPVRQPGAPRARTDRLAGTHRGYLARLSARGRARPALWLSGAWPIRTRARVPVQPAQAAARSLRQSALRTAGLE